MQFNIYATSFPAGGLCSDEFALGPFVFQACPSSALCCETISLRQEDTSGTQTDI